MKAIILTAVTVAVATLSGNALAQSHYSDKRSGDTTQRTYKADTTQTVHGPAVVTQQGGNGTYTQTNVVHGGETIKFPVRAGDTVTKAPLPRR
ncbi:hypothetical protein [Paucibacter sp. DJ2R-2]|uniref:hypothetical protein n=1 Tax=Paucibacter sp. DJ2R-2 TaxID=2893558 RepID=UPI0021E3B562|nr:hypothetical protein [Paucibacter sp. DJ2R-2]MCV2441282.1 hypothetical protein [Paucibacter sp. DJ2R-2]